MKRREWRGVLLVLVGLCAALSASAQQSANERAVWKLEADYWKFVKGFDREGFRGLFHPNFVGWPSSSAQPARNDSATDWMTELKEKGIRLQWYSIEPAASQATENIVMTHYWVTSFWSDKDGKGDPPETIRITHTWIKTPTGWQILGGMAAPPASGK